MKLLDDLLALLRPRQSSVTVNIHTLPDPREIVIRQVTDDEEARVGRMERTLEVFIRHAPEDHE